MRDIEVATHDDIHSRGSIRLRIHIDNQSPQASRESGRGEPQSHGGLPHTTLERAQTDYAHRG